MLRKLNLKNFKSWQSLDVEFAPITAFFGANSTGKSSLIQFLLLLKQTKDARDPSLALDLRAQEARLNLGSFQDVVFGHEESDSIRWKLDWRTDDVVSIADPAGRRSDAIFKSDVVSISSEVKLRGKTVVNDWLKYEFDDAEFEIIREEGRSGYRLQTSNQKNFDFLRTKGRAWDLPSPTQSYLFPDQARTYFQNSLFLGEFETAYVQQMNHLLHLGPLRDFPKREYRWSGSSPVDVGARGELVVDAILAATDAGVSYNLKPRGKNRSFQEIIAFWLQEMGLIVDFEVESIAEGTGLYRVRVKKDNSSPSALITDVGFGVGQVLPALVLLYYAPVGSTVIFEQPEIHLHPAVQSALADVIISAVKRRNIQVVIESHSEHLLHRLMRRVAEGRASPYMEIRPEDLRIYFCEMDKGRSKITDLQVNLYGGITNWPDDFFGDTFGEINAREEAALRRMSAAE